MKVNKSIFIPPTDFDRHANQQIICKYSAALQETTIDIFADTLTLGISAAILMDTFMKMRNMQSAEENALIDGVIEEALEQWKKSK